MCCPESQPSSCLYMNNSIPFPCFSVLAGCPAVCSMVGLRYCCKSFLIEADIKNNIFHAALNYATIFSGPAKINSGIVLIAFGVDFFLFIYFQLYLILWYSNQWKIFFNVLFKRKKLALGEEMWGKKIRQTVKNLKDFAIVQHAAFNTIWSCQAAGIYCNEYVCKHHTTSVYGSFDKTDFHKN